MYEKKTVTFFYAFMFDLTLKKGDKNFQTYSDSMEENGAKS